MIKRLALILFILLAIFGFLILLKEILILTIGEKPIAIDTYLNQNRTALEQHSQILLSQEKYTAIYIYDEIIDKKPRLLVHLDICGIEVHLLATKNSDNSYLLNPNQKNIRVIEFKKSNSYGIKSKYITYQDIINTYHLDPYEINEWIQFMKKNRLNYVNRRGKAVAFSINTASQKLIYTPLGINEMPFGSGNGSPMVKMDGQWTYYKGDL